VKMLVPVQAGYCQSQPYFLRRVLMPSIYWKHPTLQKVRRDLSRKVALADGRKYRHGLSKWRGGSGPRGIL